ncbi:MAG: VanW family protein [Anaerolineales bacterium]|nr:VanW family protein [Anaerolineales bacterium]
MHSKTIPTNESAKKTQPRRAVPGGTAPTKKYHNGTTRISQTTPAKKPWLETLISVQAGLMGGLLLAGLFILAFTLGFNLYYVGRIYPGVSVASIDLSGLRPEVATVLLAGQLKYPNEGLIGFQDGDKYWIAKPADIGLLFNANDSARQALAWGRRGGLAARITEQFRAWYQHVDLPPLFILDERIAYIYLQGVASQVDTPTIEASLTIQDLNVVVQPAQTGRSLDIPATLDLVRPQLSALQAVRVPLVIHENPPAIMDVEAEADIAHQILSAPLVLTVPEAKAGDPGPWKFEPAQLANILVIERVDPNQEAGNTDGGNTVAQAAPYYRVELDINRLRPLLEGEAPELARQPANPHFIFNDTTRQLELMQPGVTGRSLSVEKSLLAINEKIRQGEHTISLVFDYTLPGIKDNVTAAELGITDLASARTTYFYGSDAGRIQNITTAASHFHGLLVAPGGTFSMAPVIGSVSPETGYTDAWIIYGDRTIKGVGGGVCQVSTTLFRTAFFGGYPIVERRPHAYRVSYYEYSAGGHVDPQWAGLDATVFAPLVDFKFTNDTPYWLLMETYVNPSARTLTWKFYSTPDGRSVEWETTGLTNIVAPPKPLYQENPDLETGEIKQVDWEAEGADVTITRTVYRNGQVYFTDQFFTHYLPWRAVYEYGPGTELPVDESNGG